MKWFSFRGTTWQCNSNYFLVTLLLSCLSDYSSQLADSHLRRRRKIHARACPSAATKMTCPFTDPRKLFQDFAVSRSKDAFEYSDIYKAYVVPRYDDIVDILDQPDVFSSRPTIPDMPPPVAQVFDGKVPDRGTLLGVDNPDHDRLRKSVSSFFVPRRLNRFEPLIRRMAHELIDGFVNEGVVDIKSAFSLPLPLKTVVCLSGMDPERWEWVGHCLALYGGLNRAPNRSREEQIQNVILLHDYIADLIQQRKYDRRDDLISHIWNERDNGLEMTDFEHLSMIPGLVFAGHETSTMVLSFGLAHILHRNLWDEVSESNETRVQAIEELLRYESAITGMKRLVTREVKVRGTTFHPGDILLLAYNSGSRDPAHFDQADLLQPRRRPTTQHLGFGRGVHACLGAPLARLMLRTELAVLRERLPNMRLLTPYEELHYEPVSTNRSVRDVKIGWDIPDTKLAPLTTITEIPSTNSQSQQETHVIVEAATMVSESVVKLTLRAQNGFSLPPWTPGSHIDVKVGTFGYRQYSLCSDPQAPAKWSIAILRESEGSSHFIHDKVRQGETLLVRGPRNHFALEPSERYLFLAGGIGITPLIPMMLAAKSNGKDYRLIYIGMSRRHMAFVDELCMQHPVTIWSREEHDRRFDVASELRKLANNTSVYCCGPESLISHVQEVCSTLPTLSLKTERFGNPNLGDAGQNTDFEVELARSGRVLTVPKEKSLLDVLNANGAGILSTCTKGVCGTCEVKVLEGTPDHRDSVLTDDERRANDTMMSCVSRCKGTRLTLDLW